MHSPLTMINTLGLIQIKLLPKKTPIPFLRGGIREGLTAAMAPTLKLQNALKSYIDSCMVFSLWPFLRDFCLSIAPFNVYFLISPPLLVAKMSQI